ncbi:MAG: FMN-binding protein [Oscillospiraceae bacterium]|nr:FMN-binding protein [Oscillospiraceae bacterium]
MSEKKVKTEKAKKDLKNGAGLGQLTITLCGICAACALLLGLTNMITKPIIEANAEAKKTAAIAAEVLPGFAGTLTQVYYIGSDSSINSVQKGSDGSYVVEVSPKSSFSGTLTLLVGIDANGNIAGISATQSGETQDIGSRALEPEYLKAQYVGKTGPLELTKNGGIIEGVTGASFTSGAVKDAVNSAYEALGYLSEDASQVPDKPQEPMVSENIISMAREGDGYVAVVDCGPDSFSKTLKIQVNIGADKAVAGVTILESGETDGFGARASEPEFINQFVGATGTVALTTNGGGIESITGASTTSNAICVGVTAALQAVDYPDQWPTASAGSEEPVEDDGPVSVEQSGDGYVVTVDCGPDSFSRSLKIQVNIGADKTVTGVTILESGETDGFGARASEPEFIDQFVGKSGSVALTRDGGEIESITGASTTSNAICVGVTAALQAVESQG